MAGCTSEYSVFRWLRKAFCMYGTALELMCSTTFEWHLQVAQGSYSICGTIWHYRHEIIWRELADVPADDAAADDPASDDDIAAG